MTLRLISTDVYFSTYRTRDRECVYRVNTLPSSYFDLDAALRLRSAFGLYHLDDLIDTLRPLVMSSRAYRVDAMTECEDCEAIVTDATTISGGYKAVCDSCVTSYAYCQSCEEYVSETTYLDGVDSDVCYDCRGSFTWHECCNLWTYEYDDCECSDVCTCEAPAQRFTFAGVDADSDTLETVSLPAGVISEEGLEAIRSYLYNAGFHDATFRTYGDAGTSYLTGGHLAASIVLSLDPSAVTLEGTFAKRLARMAYRHDGTKVRADLVSMVGNLVSQHSAGASVSVDVTRDFNQGADYFHNGDSCWWNIAAIHNDGLCAFKASHGFAVRSLGNGGSWDTHGRVLVMPLDDALDPCPIADASAFLVFNGYGDLEGFTGPRVVAEMTGHTYRKVSVSGGDMYVNSNAGYLVGPVDLIATTEHVSVYTYSPCN